MFKKVLVVEDLDSIGYSIATMLKQEVDVDEVVLSQYCDDAYLKFLKAERDNAPFDLIITDLSFKADYRADKISTGQQLIRKFRERNQQIAIMVYSVEERSTLIKNLIEKFSISGYILKSRSGLKNLSEAIQVIQNGKRYLSPDLTTLLKKKDVYEVDDYDITLLNQLSHGLTQDQISSYLTHQGISPSSLSSIEKRLNRLKIELKAKTTIQLVANAKDLGLI